MHSLRHIGAAGSGLFGHPNLSGIINRPFMASSNPLNPHMLQSTSASMLTYNPLHHVRPFPLVSSSLPPSLPSGLHHLPTPGFGALAAAAAASSGGAGINNATAVAMQAAAQAMNYHQSLQSAAHFANEMSTKLPQTQPTHSPYSTSLSGAAATKQDDSIDRNAIFSSLQQAAALSDTKSSPTACSSSTISQMSPSQANLKDDEPRKKV